ncbi:TadA family conjugal transfer-associated ATPase [Enemella sp. A6]|uniref:TadA family conjugal transfer-associated ATPase n=1 Tax=Enemella sp. A6 TaxID=3440152 RepID=UPI003EBB829D
MSELTVVRPHLAELGRPPTATDVAEAMRRSGLVVTDRGVRVLMAELRRDSQGAGLLDPLLADPRVSDVLVNGAEEVWVDRGHGPERTELRFADEEDLRRLAVRMANQVGRPLDDAHPFVDARLADGTRVHAVLAGVAAPGTCLSLRIPARRRMTLDDWVRHGSLEQAGAELLRTIVRQRLAYLVSGGTGTGKTTMLAALLAEIPPDERVVVVEDSRELNPDHPHCVRLEGRPANAEGAGAITLTALVRQALRMRPDRVVLGEVRGAELCDLLTALNTGHEGGCGTVHANSAGDLPARLEALAALGGLDRMATHAQVAAALDVVIHLTRGRDGLRRVAEIGVITRTDAGLIEVLPAVVFDPVARPGPGAGLLEGKLR